jgi:hypothetical protein
LTEGEIARLSERRERWEIDRAQLLETLIESIPFRFEDQDVVPLCMFARPVATVANLLARAVGEADTETFIRDQLGGQARGVGLYRGMGFMTLSDATSVRRQARISGFSMRTASPPLNISRVWKSTWTAS